MLVVERSLSTLRSVRPKITKLWQTFNSCPVGLETWVLFKDATGLCQEVHVVEKLKHKEVNVRDIVANKELL